MELFQDDAEGYYLNTSTDAPGWFVLWRMHEGEESDAGPAARPAAVSLSYHDAGRWLDAQETVEQLPAPAGVVDWLSALVAEHHVAEPKRRKRPESFYSLSDRFGNPISISTDKARGGGHGRWFLGRWSQRKQAQRTGLPLEEPTALAPPAAAALQNDKQNDKQEASQATKQAGSAAEASVPGPPSRRVA